MAYTTLNKMVTVFYEYISYQSIINNSI